MMRACLATLRCDLQRMVRDQFLRGTALFVLGVALTLRFGLAWIATQLQQRHGIDLWTYAPLIGSYFALINSQLLTGVVMGFLLIESREEQVVRAVGVAASGALPILLSQIALIFGASLVFTFILALGLGIGVPTVGMLALTSVLAAPMAVMLALILGAFAENKVQGFAVAKILSLLGILAPVCYFLDAPWHWFGAIVPVFWACKLWWGADAWWMVGAGTAIGVFWTLTLGWIYLRRVYSASPD